MGRFLINCLEDLKFTFMYAIVLGTFAGLKKGNKLYLNYISYKFH